jgi:SAM-dependent methyltransferase
MTQTIPQVSTTASGTPGWVKWHGWNERAMQPVTSWICDASAAKAGEHVLDLGCGTGLPSLALAARVQPNGAVTAIDVSPEMLAAARKNAADVGLGNLVFREMSADSLDFDDASFDVVTSAFMLMFRPEPARTIAGARRVLKKGGRLAVVVWDAAETNPFFTTALGPVARFVSPPPTDPKGPGSFCLAGGELEKVMRAAGFEEIRVQTLPFEIAFESIERHWEIFSEMAPPVKAARETLGSADLARLKLAIAESLRPYTDGGRVMLRATCVCALATK